MRAGAADITMRIAATTDLQQSNTSTRSRTPCAAARHGGEHTGAVVLVANQREQGACGVYEVVVEVARRRALPTTHASSSRIQTWAITRPGNGTSLRI
jgi:hypothetical protein